MEERIHKTQSPPLNHSVLLGSLCLVVGGFGFLILLVMLFFLVWLLYSPNQLINNFISAWEYEPVRGQFIMSLIVFAVYVVLPLLTGYSLLKRRRWAKASVIIAAAVSLLVGLVLIINITFGAIIFALPLLALSIYAFWVIYRGALSNNSFNASGISAAFIRKTWMLDSLYAAALIRALDTLPFGLKLKLTND